MRLITHIETNTTLNAKAKALAPFVNLYTGCLFTPQQYNDFVLEIEKLLKDLNAQYPRTKPFIIYSRNKHYIYICVDGSPDKKVCTISTRLVERVIIDDSIVPIEHCNIEIKESRVTFL